jgi:hypothetical protein
MRAGGIELALRQLSITEKTLRKELNALQEK